MPAQNTPVLIGNTYRRDHFGYTVTKAEWIAAGHNWLPGSAVSSVSMFPVGMTLQQLMVCMWQVKTWRHSASGTKHNSSSFSFDKTYAHPKVVDPFEEDEKKTFLIRTISDLRDNAGAGYLDNWEDTGHDDHLPYLFSGPYKDTSGARFIVPTDSSAVAFLNMGIYEGSDGETNFDRIPLVLFDEDTGLLWPYLRSTPGAGFLGPPGLAGTTTGGISWGLHIGDLVISATGRMTDLTIPYYSGNPSGPDVANGTLQALTYW